MTKTSSEPDNNPDDPALARPESLLGQLQRGRGAGFLWASREDPKVVHPLLVECVTRDPRCDHQVESRAEYYARLVVLTSMSLESLSEYLHENDDKDQFS